jgi:arsenate reductase
MEIWINPACSKCRAATKSLDEAGVEYTIRRYLDDPPTRSELTEVLNRLGLEPWDLARTGEAAARQVGLKDIPRDGQNRDRWITALVENPILIQRPILSADDGTTVVGRDPDSVERAIKAQRGSAGAQP